MLVASLAGPFGMLLCHQAVGHLDAESLLAFLGQAAFPVSPQVLAFRRGSPPMDFQGRRATVRQ